MTNPIDFCLVFLPSSLFSCYDSNRRVNNMQEEGHIPSRRAVGAGAYGAGALLGGGHACCPNLASSGQASRPQGWHFLCVLLLCLAGNLSSLQRRTVSHKNELAHSYTVLQTWCVALLLQTHCSIKLQHLAVKCWCCAVCMPTVKLRAVMLSYRLNNACWPVDKNCTTLGTSP